MVGRTIVYDQNVVVFVSFMGATTEIDDDGQITKYIPRDEIMVNVALVNAVRDHMIATGGYKIQVMETLEEIRQKLAGR